MWLQNFGFVDSANRTLTSMLSFMNTVPNWAYNGGARSIGDLGNNGLWFVNRGTERVLQVSVHVRVCVFVCAVK